MEYSKMYEKIKRWYESKFWTDDMVHQAVSKELITQEEYDAIIVNIKEG